jgi:DNA-binding transcriptional ArsR family regulator
LSTIVLVFENNASTDLAMGRSSVRRRILTVLAQPETRLHLREIQRRAGTSPGTASRELGRLVAAGLIEREAEGNQVYFRGATTPLATMLRALLAGNVAGRPGIPPHRVSSAERAAPKPSQPNRSTLIGADSGAAAGRAAAGRAAAGRAAAGRVEERGSRSPALTTSASATAPSLAPADNSAARGSAALDDTAAAADAADAALTTTNSPDEVGLRIAARLADRIRPSYGSRLLGIYLYGPRARGEARPDSNVDVLLVLDHVDRYCDELEQTSASCADLSQEESLVVSRVFVSETAWLTRSDGQLPAIRKEAVAI